MRFVPVPVEALSREAVNGLVEEFVTRDGTDYGAKEHTLDDKKGSVMRQLLLGDAVIVFDTEAPHGFNVVLKDALRSRPKSR